MWLAANEHPDFRTINMFRNKEEDLLRRVTAVVHYCAAEAELFAKRILRKSKSSRHDKRPNWFAGVVDPEHIVSIILADCQPIVN
jgi:hypothetical protein